MMNENLGLIIDLDTISYAIIELLTRWFGVRKHSKGMHCHIILSERWWQLFVKMLVVLSVFVKWITHLSKKRKEKVVVFGS